MDSKFFTRKGKIYENSESEDDMGIKDTVASNGKNSGTICIQDT